MARKSKTLFDKIDVENLFSQWHKHVREFTENLDEGCVLELVKKTPITSFDSTQYKKIQNFTNTDKCVDTLEKVTKEKNKINFFNLLEERDSFYPREYQRGINIEEIYESIIKDDYHPILFLELNKNYYIIDGRTRFYCCIFLGIPAKIRILSDYLLKRNCIKN